MPEPSSVSLDGSPTLPFAEGIRQAASNAVSPYQAAEAKVRSARSLADLRSEFAFFTPALAYLYLPIGGRDPFHDFLAEYGKRVSVITLRFDRPLFEGLERRGGDAYWNHVLFGIEAEHWLPYLLWARTLAFWDPKRRSLARIRPMLVTIADPIFIAKASVLPPRVPTAEIGVLALDTNRGRIWLEDDGDPAMTRPRPVVSFEPPADWRIFAQALAEEDSDPYRRVELSEIPPELSGLSPEEVWLLREYGDRPPPAPPKIVDISSLPPQKQREIADFIRSNRGR